MSDSMITELLVHTGDSAAKQKALAYPSLSRAESWRWTPLKALRSISRRVDCAAYQYDFPDAVQVSETERAIWIWLSCTAKSTRLLPPSIWH